MVELEIHTTFTLLLQQSKLDIIIFVNILITLSFSSLKLKIEGYLSEHTYTNQADVEYNCK